MKEFKRGRGAYLRAAIEQGFGPPPAWEAAQQQRQAPNKQPERGVRGDNRMEHTSSAPGTPSPAEAARQRTEAIQALQEQLEREDPDRWRALVAEAESQMSPPIRARPQSAAYRAALSATTARLIGREGTDEL